MKHKGIELVPITEEQILDHDKDYAFWDEDMTTINVVHGGCVYNKKIGIDTYRLECITKFGVKYENCAELPQATMRDRTALEVISYLHHLQNYCNGISVPLGFKLPEGISNEITHFGIIMYNAGDIYGWCKVSLLTERDGATATSNIRYGILLDGDDEPTEFKMSQVEWTD